MADVMLALSKKRNKLVNEKREIEKEYKRKIAELDNELKEIDKIYSVVNDAISEYICPKCRGTGSVRITDACGDTDDYDCSECNGTGIKI